MANAVLAREAQSLAAGIAAALDSSYTVTVVNAVWIEVRVNPDNALRTDLDFVRVTVDDESYYRLIHLTHNGVCKGESTFSGSMVSFVPALVREFVETEF
ncbi:hypothetical protein [Mycolicibacterium mucogenicum]|uniref:Uncharacterized protein n=1 Tax=Mycolicibacterium mucogenicum DSM 44124 TaxID=1226753 RepID=A0A8H2JA13_MYCMU|nr:hypothetical protein [Mycolicibacterium mucogenicum]KAB7761777.1 hypothetical protein MMUC44124_01015 [Mycolicibacterium mucogenicum DSM 44124]QPG70011.1 hypothetical protein C1S78_002995 [Mycolicibacterium mucogenicum DSM 44124]